MTQDIIVVTGGAGFIGSRFIKYVFDTTKSDIVCVDKMTYAADRDRIEDYIWQDDRFSFIQKDICDLKLKDLPKDFTHLVNFAAESHVDNSIEDGSPFLKSNFEGVYNLIQVVLKRGLKGFERFVQISTDEVYGDMKTVKKYGASESHVLKPSSFYSSTKASAEMLVMSAYKTYGVPYLITRSCNNFGPNQHEEKFLPKLFKSISEGDKVPVYGDGHQVREWMHVDDNVRLVHTLMNSNGKTDVVNIGSGFGYTNLEIIELASKALGKKVKVKHVKDRRGHDRVYQLDCEYLKERVGDYMFLCLEGFFKDEVRRIDCIVDR
jgi:dTDP-glucose 4,6-dehydratase